MSIQCPPPYLPINENFIHLEQNSEGDVFPLIIDCSLDPTISSHSYIGPTSSNFNLHLHHLMS